MIGDSNLSPLLESFGNQFERTADGRYVYRQSQKGPPIPVSADERERFTQRYLEALRFTYWGMMAVVLAFVGGVIWWTISTHVNPTVILVGGLIAILVGFVWLSTWVRAAPARELSRRTPVGVARTREEMRELTLHRISYSQLASVVVMAVLLLARIAWKEDIFSGWNRLWLVFAAGMVLLAAIQAFRKWRFERTNAGAP